MGRTAQHDWRTIMREYVEGGETLAQLSMRFRVTETSIRRHSSTGKWKVKRAEYRKDQRKSGRKVPGKAAPRVAASTGAGAGEPQLVVPTRLEDDALVLERIRRLQRLEIAMIQQLEAQIKLGLTRLEGSK